MDIKQAIRSIERKKRIRKLSFEKTRWRFKRLRKEPILGNKKELKARLAMARWFLRQCNGDEHVAFRCLEKAANEFRSK